MTDTDPIQPTDGAAAATDPPVEETAVDVITEATTDAIGSGVAEASNIDAIIGGRSPLRGQFIGERGQPRPMPLKIIFQDGVYAGKALDLGTAIEEMDTSQDSQWSPSGNKNIRAGANFDGMGPRSLSFSLEFADSYENIMYLSEMAAHTTEVDPGQKRPPFLIMVFGEDHSVPGWVANRFTVKLDEPFAGDRGFKRATVDADFALYGGVNSPYASGTPLFPTPLKDEAQSEIAIDRQRQAAQEVAELILADCLSEQANRELSPLAARGQVTDPREALNLGPEAILQGAIAGMFTGDVLDDEQVQRKIEGALASVMAANEPGIGNTSYAREFGNALLTGDTSRIAESRAKLQAQNRIPFFNDIYDAIIAQDLGEDGKIFSTEAGDWLRTRVGPCGLLLRQTGTVHSISADETEIIQEMRDFLSESPKKDEIRRRFGLTEDEDEELRLIQNGQPFRNKEEFLEHMSQRGRSAYRAEVLWGNFEASEAAGADDAADPPS